VVLADLAVVGRFAVAVLLGASAAAKLGPVGFSMFASSLGRFGVPVRMRRPAARAVVALEALLTLALLVPPTARPAGAVAAVVLAAFTVALGGRLRAGDRAPCACFGASSGRLGPASIVRNVVAAGLAVLGAAGAGSVELAAAVPLALAGVAVGVALVRADALGALFAPYPEGSPR
jgi:hypothetical protein